MPNRFLVVALCAGILTAAGAGIGHAKSEKAHGAGKSAKGGDSGAGAAAVGAIAGSVIAGLLLSDHDRSTITRYFQQHPQPATALPPGVAKNLARGKPLPPGIAKRGLPNALTSRLSIPSGRMSYSFRSGGRIRRTPNWVISYGNRPRQRP